MALEARFCMHCVLCGTAFLNLFFGLCSCQSILFLSLIAVSTDQYNTVFFFLADNNADMNSLPGIQPTLLNSQRALPLTTDIVCQSGWKKNVSIEIKDVFAILTLHIKNHSRAVLENGAENDKLTVTGESEWSDFKSTPVFLTYGLHTGLDRRKQFLNFKMQHLSFCSLKNGG